MFTLFPNAAQPPADLSVSVAGLVGGISVALQIVSGANVANVAVFRYVAGIEVIDPIAFAALPARLSVGWQGSPLIVSVNTTVPTAIGGSGSTGPIFSPGAITSQGGPSLVPAPKWNETSLASWMWTSAAPPPPFKPPRPIAWVTGGPAFVSLLSSDAGAGAPVTFQVVGS